jgi:RecA-family ATPase
VGNLFQERSWDVGDDGPDFDSEPPDYLDLLLSTLPGDVQAHPSELPVPNGKVTIDLSGITIEQVRWLWPLRVPLGKISIIEGDPETGKSTITLDIAARVSTGTPMPFESRARVEPAGVVVVCGEDDLGDTIIPRLLAHRADLTMIGSVLLDRDENKQLIPLTIPEDMLRLDRAIRERDAKLMIIDPITAYLSGTINTSNDASVRRAMLPLGDLAQKTGCAILLIRHLNKTSDQKAKYRGGGSIAFTGAARSVLVCDTHPERDDGTRVMARVKNNLAANVESLTYQLGTEELYDCPHIHWTGTDDIDADTLVRGKDGRFNAPERDEAEAFLSAFLEAGPRKADDCLKIGRQSGISESTLRRAKKKLNISANAHFDTNGKFDFWVWELER